MKLNVFEKRLLRRIFLPKTNKKYEARDKCIVSFINYALHQI
jgi:hypothetical protein